MREENYTVEVYKMTPLRLPLRLRIAARWERLRFRLRYGREAVELRDELLAATQRDVERAVIFGEEAPGD